MVPIRDTRRGRTTSRTKSTHYTNSSSVFYVLKLTSGQKDPIWLITLGCWLWPHNSVSLVVRCLKNRRKSGSGKLSEERVNSWLFTNQWGLCYNRDEIHTRGYSITLNLWGIQSKGTGDSVLIGWTPSTSNDTGILSLYHKPSWNICFGVK